jgi:2-polyprenyl-6-methoxyphenol hydroxylase-like FAD-dependent oxidoreductase
VLHEPGFSRGHGSLPQQAQAGLEGQIEARNSKRRALVIGGSLGGLFAGNLLHDLGWQVDIYERVPDDLASRGAGIGTHRELLSVLAGLGIAMEERLGAESGDRVCLDREGNEVHRTGWAHIMSGWANVYRPLKDRFPAQRYHFGKGFTRFKCEGGQIVACFDDGSQASADLLIGADGLRSAVRAQLFPGLEPAYAGYVAWRALLDEHTLPLELRRRLGNVYWFGLPPGEMIVAYRVPARDGAPGHRDWNIVWYRPIVGDEALRDLCTDARGHHHGPSIPPPLVRPEVVAALKRDARALLAPLIAELVERSQPFFQAIFDVESPRLAVGRVCLLGDAAFVARPHVGMGVTKAALDALCLANSLRQPDFDVALARYDRLRGEFGRRCVARARRLGAYIEARARPDRGWTAEQRDQRPERVMREVAASLSEIPELALEV